jgi:flagellar capping protein FliD
MALNSYQTHKDYYRVSAVSGITGGKSNTIRRPLDMPFEELAYKQHAQSAAKGVAEFVQSSQNVKQSAQSLVESRLPAIAYMATNLSSENDSESIIEPIRQFVHTYNEFQDSLRDSPEYLNRSLLIGLEQAAKPYSLKEIGITKLDNGSLELQEDELQDQIKNHSSSTLKSLGSLTNFAATLSNSIGQLQQLPSESLFQMSRSQLKPYGQYRSHLQSYLPVPMSGLLLDVQM